MTVLFNPIQSNPIRIVQTWAIRWCQQAFSSSQALSWAPSFVRAFVGRIRTPVISIHIRTCDQLSDSLPVSGTDYPPELHHTHRRNGINHICIRNESLVFRSFWSTQMVKIFNKSFSFKLPQLFGGRSSPKMVGNVSCVVKMCDVTQYIPCCAYSVLCRSHT